MTMEFTTHADPIRNQIVVMLSGGLDSVIAWAYLGKPTCIHVNLGVLYSAKEEAVVEMLSDKWGMLTWFVKLSPPLIVLGNTSPTETNPFLPARNLLLATLGAQRYSSICIGGVRGDQVEDKSPIAYAEMSLLLTKQSRKQVTVFSPFWSLTKTQLVAWYLDQGYPVELLHDSVSCYRAEMDSLQCGNCGSCFRKWVALANNGIDPGFILSQTIVEYYQKEIYKPGYDPTRVVDTELALKHRMQKLVTVHYANVPDYFPANPYVIAYKETEDAT